ncbi:hypothetical protein B0H66DRAFT_529152 [Apodospora peruviana]|uniref:Uncharacterized protein n=1 Tax=Apodospora peruviana TaxID=516989 RepID=A0AAE0MA87_9PEZI|nr:hypothetical protein B0H66DRAFT_529152 [Apodospora peruviana]
MDAPITTGGRPLNAVHRLSLRYLVVPPILLAILTALILFAHSDTNLPMLYSQCHARARLPWITHHVPVIATPLCFLVSFFQEALASVRSACIMSGVLSFIAGLLTVSTVEAARICNAPSILIAYPTGAWLVFNLAGGAIVWQLVIIPAFFHRSREIILARRQGVSDLTGPTDPNFGEQMRHLTKVAEIVAIPVAVAVGYILPSILMIALNSTDSAGITVLVWLLFPVWVSLIRQAIRKGMTLFLSDDWDASFHLESSRLALAGMYALPVLCSIVSHALFLYSFFRPNDEKEMTRATLKFIVIDAFFIALTTLYWLFVEAGWKVALVCVAASVVAGPGAGICVGWFYREATVDPDRASVTVVAVGTSSSRRGSGNGDGSGASSAHSSEETPLLRS